MINSLLHRWAPWLCATLLCALLGACATPQRIGHGAASESAFERTGRFALSVNHQNGKQDAVQGGFAWRDAGGILQLDLVNPMGSTLARVQVVPGHATLTRSDGSQERAHDPDALVEQVLGSPIPVGGMREWLRGESRGATAVQRDSNGQLSAFVQDGWRVQLSRYDERGPRLLQLNRHEATRDISVRLAVSAD